MDRQQHQPVASKTGGEYLRHDPPGTSIRRPTVSPSALNALRHCRWGAAGSVRADRAAAHPSLWCRRPRRRSPVGGVADRQADLDPRTVDTQGAIVPCLPAAEERNSTMTNQARQPAKVGPTSSRPKRTWLCPSHRTPTSCLLCMWRRRGMPCRIFFEMNWAFDLDRSALGRIIARTKTLMQCVQPGITSTSACPSPSTIFSATTAAALKEGCWPGYAE